jgi:phosphoribosylanthranilate isomerase
LKPIVKICGVTRVQDAIVATMLGADLIGLNLFPKSPRSITLAKAREIADSVRGKVQLVGVFVNTPTAQVMAAIDLLGLDLAQLHGDEWPEEVQALGRRAIKVFRSLPVTETHLARFPSVWGYLVDTPNPKLFGGTGVVWDWSSLRAVNSPRPILVAGGIGPDNARRALAESGATGLDVNSGVEAAPGIKSAAKLQRLFEELKDVEV